jgi:hypothetical protein
MNRRCACADITTGSGSVSCGFRRLPKITLCDVVFVAMAITHLSAAAI